MKRTKLRIYLAVILLGLAALVVDRWRGSRRRPASAEASNVVASAPRPPAGETATSPNQPLSVTMPAFPKLASDPLRLAGVRDPFTIAAAARSALLPAPPPPEEQEQGRGTLAPSAAFRAAHRLHAIVFVSAARVAVLDGVMVSEGQRIDDCDLERISERSVRFACPDADVDLVIESSLTGPDRR